MQSTSSSTDPHAKVVAISKRVNGALAPLLSAALGATATRLARRGLQAAFAVAATAALASPPVAAPADAPPAVPSAAVAARGGSGSTSYEGVVEALRQTVVAAQVPGAVVALQVRAGDKVQAGQVLMRIDARAADQTAAAGAAQARAARAALEAAAVISSGSSSCSRRASSARRRSTGRMPNSRRRRRSVRATGQRRCRQDAVRLLRRQGALWRRGGRVSVVLGDMAMPGRPLLTLYDPAALRVAAAIPQTAVAAAGGAFAPQAEIPGAAAKPGQAGPCPAAAHGRRGQPDAGIAPGPAARHGCRARHVRPRVVARPRRGRRRDARLFVPSQALVRRSELAAVYVIGRDGKPLLRQVRPGRSEGSQVEILSGVAAGERVALDPQAAARIR